MTVRLILPRHTLLQKPRICHLKNPTLTTTRTLRPSSTQPFSTTTTTTATSTITAARTLPYAAYPVFQTIADIPSYPQFLPYVSAAHVLTRSPREDSHHQQRWPALASLTIGFPDRGISETFASAVYCVPPVPHKGRADVGFVEALSGSEAPLPTFVDGEDAAHYDVGAGLPAEAMKGPLRLLRSRWTVRGYPHKPAPNDGAATHQVNLEPESKARQMTDVSLSVDFAFENPLYGALSKAAGGKIAEMMVDAFEQRVRDVLG